MNINIFCELRNHKYINILRLCIVRSINFLLARFRSFIVLIYSTWLLSPWSSAQKDLTGIGTLFLGVAALLGLFAVKDRWKETRQSAATEILSLIRGSIDYINEIILKPSLYMHNGYYPFNIPETQNKEELPTDWTRPNRLISNKIGNLKADLNLPLSKFIGKEYYLVLKLMERLEKECKSITGWLQAELGNHPDKLRIIQLYQPNEYLETLKSILKEAEGLLFPVIKEN